MNLFVTFGHWSKILRFLRNRYRQVCQNWFLRVARKKMRPKYFLKKPPLIFFPTSIELFSAFCRKFFWRGCQNCLLRVHSNILWENCLKFSDVGQKILGILWESLRQGCRNCFPVAHGNKLSRKTFRGKPYVFLFRHWAERFHFCPKVFWLGCQKCISPGSRIFLSRNIPFQFLPHLFRTLSKKSPWFCRMFINWVVKTAFVVSVRAPRVEYFLEKSCRVLFITFGLSDKKILLSDKNISPCLSKVHSKCPLEQFEERFSLEILLASFRALAKNIRFFLE